MNVTVIGSGNMGSAFVQQLTKAGHQVSVTGRDAAKARALAARYGARAVAAADAALDSELVGLAPAYPDAVSAFRTIGPRAGQVVVDITNPLTDDYMGLTVGHTTSAAEEIARAVPGVHIVKAFNTVLKALTMCTPGTARAISSAADVVCPTVRPM